MTPERRDAIVVTLRGAAAGADAAGNDWFARDLRDAADALEAMKAPQPRQPLPPLPVLSEGWDGQPELLARMLADGKVKP